jgi:hypothetical protein
VDNFPKSTKKSFRPVSYWLNNPPSLRSVMKSLSRLPALASALMLASAANLLPPLRGADNSPVRSTATALAEPGPLPEGTIELLAITYDHDLMSSFGDDNLPEVFGKWWWRSIDLSATVPSRSYTLGW